MGVITLLAWTKVSVSGENGDTNRSRLNSEDPRIPQRALDLALDIQARRALRLTDSRAISTVCILLYAFRSYALESARHGILALRSPQPPQALFEISQTAHITHTWPCLPVSWRKERPGTSDKAKSRNQSYLRFLPKYTSSMECGDCPRVRCACWPLALLYQL